MARFTPPTDDKNPSAVLTYANNVRSFANSVRCRASRSRIGASSVSGIGEADPPAATIPHQQAKLNRPEEKNRAR